MVISGGRERQQETFWDVSKFGVVGDGSTDNFQALSSLRDLIIDNHNDTLNTLYFPPGIYDYSENIWVRNLRHLKLTGQNATLRCTQIASPFDADRNPFYFGSLLEQNGINKQMDLRAYKATYAFNSIAAGQKTLTFATPGDGSNFSVGDRVLVSGWNRQEGGYPPNPYYAERMEVESVTANDITFVRPILFTYDDRWYSFQFQPTFNADHTFGEPCIIKYDEGIHIAIRTLILEGLTIADNPNAIGRDTILIGSDCLKVVNCRFKTKVVPTVSGEVTFEGSILEANTEVDKILDVVDFDRCKFGGQDLSETSTLGGASGAKIVRLSNSEVYGRGRFNPIFLAEYDGNTFLNYDTGNFEVIDHGFNFSTDLMVVKNNRLDGQVANDLAFVSVVGAQKSLTVAAVGGAGEIQIVNNLANRETAYQDLSIGTFIFEPTFANAGYVTNVYNSGGNIVLEGTWRTPSVAQVYKWQLTKSWDVRNNFANSAVIGNAIGRAWQIRELFCPGQDVNRYTVTYSSENRAFNFNEVNNGVAAYLISIEVFISEAYSGPSGSNITVQFRRDDGTGSNVGSQTIDLKTVGYRRIHADSSLSTTPLGVDSFDQAQLGVWYDEIDIVFREGAGGLTETDLSVLAKGYFKFEFYNPRGVNS